MGFNEAMQEVLELPKYDILTGRAVDYQQIITDALVNALINIISRINLSLNDSPEYNLQLILNFFIVIAALIFLGAAIGIVYILLKLRARKNHELGVTEIFENVENKRYTLSDLLRHSVKYAEMREYRKAIRHKYIAILVKLNDNNTIQVNKSKTNYRLSNELSVAAPDLSESFGIVVNMFHASWFGKQDVCEEDFNFFSKAAEELLHAK